MISKKPCCPTIIPEQAVPGFSCSIRVLNQINHIVHNAATSTVNECGSRQSRHEVMSTQEVCMKMLEQEIA